MQVFKAYFKIIRHNLTGTIIYFFVFLLVSVLLTLSGNKVPQQEEFKQSSARITIVNEDQPSAMVNGLIALLGKQYEIIDIASAEAIQEALFYREIEYALRIPAGFADAFYLPQPLQLDSNQVPDSYIGTYVDLSINQYLNTLRLYGNYDSAQQEAQIQLVSAMMEQHTPVMLKEQQPVVQKDILFRYVNNTSYIILAAILFCITSFMIQFNEPEIRKRTDCSPRRRWTIDLTILAANGTVAGIVLLVLILLAAILCNGAIFSVKGLLYIAVMAAYAFMCIALAFMLSILLQKKTILTAIVTTLSLGFSFLGGTFVPLELLSEQVHLIGSFVPSFWFTIACENIASVMEITISELQPMLKGIALILCFGLAFLSLGLLFANLKKTSIHV